MSNDQYSKTQSTYYTPKRVSAARKNVQTKPWAAEFRDEVVEQAETALEEGLDALWNEVTGQKIPRSLTPGDGTQRNRWTPVPDEPWALTDGDWVLPTNDFAAYRESGRDERGVFDPELADDDLLVNERYPEKGPDWGVDDGWGWVDENGEIGEAGTRFVPVAAYNHWHVWYALRDTVVALRDAYLYTGERRYARAGTVVLDRLADVYPDLDLSAFDLDRFKNSHGGPGEGKMVGAIWETNLVRDFMSAYDAFFPAQDGDEKLITFLSEKADMYSGLPSKESVASVRRNVEDGLVRQVLPGIKNAQIHGNLGMHQSALAMSAVVLDEPEGYTGRALEFLFQAGGLRDEDDRPWEVADDDIGEARRRNWRVTGGNVETALVDRIDRDGYADESAPNYNAIIQSQLLRIADILDAYDGADNADLYDHPKLSKVAQAHFPLLMSSRYMPSIGDSGKTGDPDTLIGPQKALRGYEAYGDDELARAAHLLNGRSTDGLHGDVFSSDAGEIAEQIEAIVDRAGTYDPGSRMFPDYGFVALRDGDGEQRGRSPPDGSIPDRNETGSDGRRGVCQFFGRNSIETGTSHSHHDTLNLGLYAHGLALMPDLGYPEFTADWPKRIQWTKNTVSHNTVVVDAERQHPQTVGVPQHFHNGTDVQIADVEAPAVYPQTDAYRRTTAMIRIDGVDSYVVDFFDVDGGDDHLYSLHGAEGSVEAVGIEPEEIPGTYAGQNVSRPSSGEVTDYDERVGSGFNYLTDVERDEKPTSPFSVEWDVVDTWDVREDDVDVRLRATVLTDCDDVALADGEPPTNKDGNPESIRYLLCRRRGKDLRSTFTSVLEPYEGDRRVERIEPVSVRHADDAAAEAGTAVAARAVRVELDTGRVDYLARAPDDGAVTVGDAFTFDGFFARYSTDGDGPCAATLVDGTSLRSTSTGETLLDRPVSVRFEGRVVDFTREMSSENRVVVDPAVSADVEAAVGDYLYVDIEGDANGVYPIEDIAATEDGTLSVDIGGMTPIRRFVDPSEPEKGYVYDLAEGASARSPGVATWTRD